MLSPAAGGAAPPQVAFARRIPAPFDPERMDADALKVVRRLLRYGHEAYLVGGGVRDLLLGRRPKDFDVATSARPEQVRALFRNSRIIGRRFRLVHVLFANGKVIEVATFRRAPERLVDGEQELDVANEQLLIRSDNLYGEAHEDAVRRDLTINALLYDIERREVLDFAGGYEDLMRQVVRTIGDPVVRFLEDPVRMVRSIKFAARLDLGIAPEVYDAIVLCRDALTHAARPRLFEELLKVLRCGASHRAVWLMWETGVLHSLLPELAAYLDDTKPDDDRGRRPWRTLREVDRRTRTLGKPLDDIALVTLLLLEPLREAASTSRNRAQAAMDFVDPVFRRLAVPRRLSVGVCRVVAALPRLARNRPGRFARSDLYAIAVEVASVERESCGLADASASIT